LIKSEERSSVEKNFFSVGKNMADVVVTNLPTVRLPTAPTPHPGAKYAKNYKVLGVRNVRLIVLQFRALVFFL